MKGLLEGVALVRYYTIQNFGLERVKLFFNIIQNFFIYTFIGFLRVNKK